MSEESMRIPTRDLNSAFPAHAECFINVEHHSIIISVASLDKFNSPIEPKTDACNMLMMSEFEYDIRQDRRKIICGDLCDSPCWDILLLLYMRQAKSQIVNVKDLASNCNHSNFIALRWLRVLVAYGLAGISDCNTDEFNNQVQLTHKGVQDVETYLRMKSARLAEMLRVFSKNSNYRDAG